MLSTRPDLLGEQVTTDLASLQDRLPPFDQNLARREIKDGLGEDVDTLFSDFGPAVAAASIAQVHRCKTKGEGGGKDGGADAGREHWRCVEDWRLVDGRW